VYDRPLYRDSVVVAPCLFGSELNTTIFHDLRQEMQHIMRHDPVHPTWSFDTHTRPGTMVVFPSRELMAKSGAAREVVRRICQYFSIELNASGGVGLAHRRGNPACHYRSGALYVLSCLALSEDTLCVSFQRTCLSHAVPCLLLPPKAARPEHFGRGHVRQSHDSFSATIRVVVRHWRRPTVRIADPPPSSQQLHGGLGRGRARCGRL
jgi:hypothetical protein